VLLHWTEGHQDLARRKKAEDQSKLEKDESKVECFSSGKRGHYKNRYLVNRHSRQKKSDENDPRRSCVIWDASMHLIYQIHSMNVVGRF
jgi:hypothetical protein